MIPIIKAEHRAIKSATKEDLKEAITNFIRAQTTYKGDLGLKVEVIDDSCGYKVSYKYCANRIMTVGWHALLFYVDSLEISEINAYTETTGKGTFLFIKDARTFLNAIT